MSKKFKVTDSSWNLENIQKANAHATCPLCEKEFEVPIGEIAKQDTITCPHCNEILDVPTRK